MKEELNSIVKLEKGKKGFIYELKNESVAVCRYTYIKNWYNSLSLRKKIKLLNSGEIRIPF